MSEFSLKPDSAPVLPQGVAVPYLAIFNAQQAVIRDPQNGLPLGTFVTRFEYNYEEEKVDSGKITIETNNPDLVGLTELGYQQGLQLQWGYIYPDKTSYCGPLRKVIITGQQVDFTSSGVKITIEFSDYSILLKNAPANYYDNTKGFVKYVEDLCKGLPIGIALIDYNTKSTLKPKVAQKVVDGGEIYNNHPINQNTGSELATGSPLNKLSPKEMVQVPTTVCPDAVGVKILEYNADTRRLAIEDSDNFRVVYLEELEAAAGAIVGTSRSKYYQLQDVCRSLSGGPFFLDSRDGKIIIHNAKASRSILKVYTYMGGYGELLEFKIKSNFTKSSAEVKQATNIDPDTKSLDTTLVQGVVDPDQGNEDGRDVDLYMRWPNLGTHYWNPGVQVPSLEAAGSSNYGGSITKPGSVGQWENSASWGSSPDSKNRNGGSPINPEYHTTIVDPVSKVKAQEEKPTSVSRSFRSIKEAKQFYNTHPHVSQEEIDSYFTQWISDWNSKKTATDPNSLAELAHELDSIPPFKITRRIKIAADVNLENLGGSRGLKNSKVTSEQTETFKNAVLSGQVDLNSYNSNYYSTPSAEGIRNNALVMRGTYIRNAKALLHSVPGLTILDEASKTENKIVLLETDITLELNGVDVTAGADTINLGGFMGNDIVEKITNQVKAEAIVVGDPSIESSMNIQVQNISSKFTGLWYTKKVTHTIDSSGYLTKIEFVQRTIPVSTVTLKSNWSKKDYGKQLLDSIKQAKETGDYRYPSQVTKRIKSELKEHPTQSIVAQTDPTTGKVVYSQLDMVSGDYVRRTDGQVDYSKQYADYLQDLQKQVDQLP